MLWQYCRYAKEVSTLLCEVKPSGVCRLDCGVGSVIQNLYLICLFFEPCQQFY
jgi:hypothetical protein